jgi:hypothetical protein
MLLVFSLNNLSLLCKYKQRIYVSSLLSNHEGLLLYYCISKQMQTIVIGMHAPTVCFLELFKSFSGVVKVEHSALSVCLPRSSFTTQTTTRFVIQY